MFFLLSAGYLFFSLAVMSAVDWRVVVSVSLLAGILSLLTSVAGLP